MHKAGTRSSFCPDVDFPAVQTETWQRSGHLLNFGELIGGILTTRKTSAEEACRQVSKINVQHWISRNVYPLAWQNVHTKLLKDYTEFIAVRKLVMKSSYTEATKVRYAVLKDMKDKVYDIYALHSSQPATKKRKTDLEDLLDIRMGPKEHEYLENQLSDIGRGDPRKILCVPKKMDIDPVWDTQQQKKASLEEYQAKQIQSTEEYLAKQIQSTAEQFKTVTMDDSLVDINNNNNDEDYFDDKDSEESKNKRKYKKLLRILMILSLWNTAMSGLERAKFWTSFTWLLVTLLVRVYQLEKL